MCYVIFFTCLDINYFDQDNDNDNTIIDLNIIHELCSIYEYSTLDMIDEKNDNIISDEFDGQKEVFPSDDLVTLMCMPLLHQHEKETKTNAQLNLIKVISTCQIEATTLLEHAL